MKTLLSLLIIGFSLQATAEVIEFPQEELASETVLPVFDKTEVVKDRNVTLSKRFELGGGFGFSLVEPLYDNKSLNVHGTYHLDENQGINLYANLMFDGLSGTGNDLKNGEGLDGSQTFNPDNAPSPERYILLNYSFNAYYGKISITKQKVMNISLYGLLGTGMVNFGDSDAFTLNVGFGQKLYFTPNFGLRLDLIFTTFTGPDPTTMGQVTTPGDADNRSWSSDELGEIRYYKTFFNAGVVFLL